MDGDQTVLFVLTSHRHLGNTGERTGYHFEEMATPYYILQDAGIRVEIASIKGGLPPVEPTSYDRLNKQKNPASVNRFFGDMEAMYKLGNTLPVGGYDIQGFKAVCLPGGHGAMWDFPDHEKLQKILRESFQREKPIAAISHGPAALVNVTFHGKHVVQNHKINSFTNEEERAEGRDKIVPFLLESRLRAKGANFKATKAGKPICIESGPFITGQNPASAGLVAKRLLGRIAELNRQAA